MSYFVSGWCLHPRKEILQLEHPSLIKIKTIDSHGIVLDIAGIAGACTLHVRGIRGFICCKVCRRKTQTPHATCSIFHHCLPYSLHGPLFSHSIVLDLPGAAHLCILQDLQAFGVKANSLLVAQLWKVVPKLSDNKNSAWASVVRPTAKIQDVLAAGPVCIFFCSVQPPCILFIMFDVSLMEASCCG